MCYVHIYFTSIFTLKYHCRNIHIERVNAPVLSEGHPWRRAELKELLPRERETSWSVEGESFPLLVQLLHLPPYREKILLGLVVSGEAGEGSQGQPLQPPRQDERGAVGGILRKSPGCLQVSSEGGQGHSAATEVGD